MSNERAPCKHTANNLTTPCAYTFSRLVEETYKLFVCMLLKFLIEYLMRLGNIRDGHITS